MAFETVRIAYTKGDYATQPGGIILRKRIMNDGEVEYIAHTFNRDYGSKEPREFYWGRYCATEQAGNRAFSEKYDRATRWTAGGALIPDYDLAHQLEMERREHAHS